jgi:hypothetical protein
MTIPTETLEDWLNFVPGPIATDIRAILAQREERE